MAKKQKKPRDEKPPQAPAEKPEPHRGIFRADDPKVLWALRQYLKHPKDDD
jgi:hypothetical protein